MWTTTTLIQKCKQHKFSDHVRNDEDRVVKKVRASNTEIPVESEIQAE